MEMKQQRYKDLVHKLFARPLDVIENEEPWSRRDSYIFKSTVMIIGIQKEKKKGE